MERSSSEYTYEEKNETDIEVGISETAKEAIANFDVKGREPMALFNDTIDNRLAPKTRHLRFQA